MHSFLFKKNQIFDNFQKGETGRNFEGRTLQFIAFGSSFIPS